MKVRLLSSNLSDPNHLQSMTTFLINDALTIDGGSLGFALGLDAQRLIKKIVVTHTHSDHIASLPVFIAEVFPFLKEPVSLHSTSEILADLRNYIFNDSICPDFHRLELPGGIGAALQYVEAQPLVSFVIENLQLTLIPVNHTVPTVGVMVEDADASIIITSDTCRTDTIWDIAGRTKRLKAVFADVSYPNEMEALAIASGHMTPQILEAELHKMNREIPVYAVHLKPQFRAKVIEQLAGIKRPVVKACEIGREYVF